MDKIESFHVMARHAYNLAADAYHKLFHNAMNEKEKDPQKFVLRREVKMKSLKMFLFLLLLLLLMAMTEM